jgi:hypothetical protein
MAFPRMLLQRNRNPLERELIKNHHYMFMRNKPGLNWDNNACLPDFTTIRSDQSFNWCKYSLPHWTRFNDKKEYLDDYAVVGLYVNTIRKTSLYCNKYIDGIFKIYHIPQEFNYSHCEIAFTQDNLNKPQKREIRMTLKHKAKTYLKPFQKPNYIFKIINWARFIIYKIK